VPRVDDGQVISGIIHVIRNGLMWRDTTAASEPYKALYDRIERWSQAGVFDRTSAALAAESAATDTVMIDAGSLKAHRTAASLRKGGLVPRCIGRTKGGLNSKRHAVCDAGGKPLILLLTEGQVSDYRGAPTVLEALPLDATSMIADRGYDSDWFRQAVSEQEIAPCILGRSSRKVPITHDTEIYKQRNLVERMFGRLNDWRRIATRYNRCAHAFTSAICITATLTFWL
jgi:transposase